MIVATEDDFKPFEFVQDGKPTGFDNELLAILRKSVPFEVRQEIIPWTGLLAGVSTGKYDMALTAVLITKERSQSLGLHDADCRRHALLRQAQERRQHQGDQGPQRQDPRSPGRKRVAAARPRAGGDAGEDRWKDRQDRRVHLVPGGVPGSRHRPDRLRHQHGDQSPSAGEGEAERLRTRAGRDRTFVSCLGGEEGEHRVARVGERFPGEAARERNHGRTGKEMVRQDIRQAAHVPSRRSSNRARR